MTLLASDSVDQVNKVCLCVNVCVRVCVSANKSAEADRFGPQTCCRCHIQNRGVGCCPLYVRAPCGQEQGGVTGCSASSTDTRRHRCIALTYTHSRIMQNERPLSSCLGVASLCDVDVINHL